MGIVFMLVALPILTAHIVFWFVLGNNLTLQNNKDKVKDTWSDEGAFIVCFIGWLITLPIVMRLLEIIEKALNI